MIVIGHGSSPTGKGWGEQIDRHTVIRFHEWNLWQTPEDYGSRIDICVAHEKFTVEALAHDCDVFLFDTNKDWTVKYRDMQRDAGAVCTINQVNPTRGFVAAMYAMEVLKTKRLILVGCDGMLNGVIDEKHYPQAVVDGMKEVYDGLDVKERMDQFSGLHYNTRHDYKVEGDLLRKYAKIYGVDLIEDVNYFV